METKLNRFRASLNWDENPENLEKAYYDKLEAKHPETFKPIKKY